MALTRAGVARDTDAMAAGRFPAGEPLNDIGRRQAEAVAAQVNRDARGFAAPERGARQTAQLLVCTRRRNRDWPTWIADGGVGRPSGH